MTTKEDYQEQFNLFKVCTQIVEMMKIYLTSYKKLNSGNN